MITASDFLYWLGSASLHAGVLVLIILAIKSLAGRGITPWWHFALWLLVMARLISPAGPESPVSMGNLFRVSGLSALDARTPRQLKGFLPASNPSSAAEVPGPASERIPADLLAPVPMAKVLFFAWAVGAFMVLLALLINCRRLVNIIRRAVPVHDPRAQEVWRECCSLIGVSRRISFLQTDEISTPALAGVFRPVVLLPPATLATATPGELRFIILHELTHLRRGDLMVGAAAALLQAMHWFNPLLWIAWSRMRADRELACDAAVVRLLGRDHAVGYSRTILKMAEAASAARSLAGSIGIIEVKSETGKRLLMISQHHKQTRFRAVCGFLIAVIIGVAGFTKAESANVDDPAATIEGVSGALPTAPPLTDGETPFTLTVHEQTGELTYTFAPDKTLESINAKSGVTLKTSNTVIRCDTFEYTSTTQQIVARGPGLEVELGQGNIDMEITGKKLNYDLTKLRLEFEGSPVVTQRGPDGQVTRTSGEKIAIVTAGGKFQLRVTDKK